MLLPRQLANGLQYTVTGQTGFGDPASNVYLANGKLHTQLMRRDMLLRVSVSKESVFGHCNLGQSEYSAKPDAAIQKGVIDQH